MIHVHMYEFPHFLKHNKEKKPDALVCSAQDVFKGLSKDNSYT